jgi:DNA polymerase-3 subunit delta'
VRVVRILDAECLREEAANALLKTLEEPAGETFFQLVTSNPARLLTTIRSRCMPLRFGPLAHEDVVRVLAGFGHEGSAASDAARLAGGSPGLAMHRIESTAFGQREGVLAAFLAAIGGSDADALEHAHELAGDRGGLDETLTVLRTLVRDAAILTTGASERNLRDPAAVRMARELARMGTASVVRIAQKIEEVDALLAGNVNARLCMESLLLECVQAARGARAGG